MGGEVELLTWRSYGRVIPGSSPWQIISCILQTIEGMRTTLMALWQLLWHLLGAGITDIMTVVWGRGGIKHLSIEVWCRYFLMFLLTLCSIQSLCAPIKEQPTIIWLFMRSLDLSTLKRNRTARESNGNKQYNMISRKNICFLLHLNSLWQYCWKHYFY